MNVILVSSRRSSVRMITLGRTHLMAAAAAALLTLLMLSVLVNYAMARLVAGWNAPAAVLSGQAEGLAGAPSERYLRDDLDAMATRLGELQAQILRLDTLGERVARLAGFRPQELAVDPRSVGALPVLPSDPLSFTELARRLEFLAKQVDVRGDAFGLLDSLLTLANVKKQLQPSLVPVREGVFSSPFGLRLDPFERRQAFHGGIDFTAKPGTPIVAAAAGVVVAAEYHGQYGNMIEIDHGNGLTTLYGHCSRRLAKVGDVVMQGATIAEVGSTGRATGPHLHFEVRHHGVPQNPARFVRLPG